MIKPKVKTSPTYIPFNLLRQSRKAYEQNKFVLYLLRLFGTDKTKELIATYHLGTSNSRWYGATVFWFIDINGNIRAGQVKLFDDVGHTAKRINTDGEQKSCTSWVHTIFKCKQEKENLPVPGWLIEYQEQGNYVSCLFGEHLLKSNQAKPVAIVEAPATAIVASVYLPAFTWLAIGSLSYLTAERCQALKGRQVYLFPDISKDGKAYDLWNKKVKELTHITTFTVSDLLERAANNEERLKGLDLRDYLTRFDFRLFQDTTKSSNVEPEPDYLLYLNDQVYTVTNLVCITHLGARFENCIITSFSLKIGQNKGNGDILFNAAGHLLTINNGLLRMIEHTFNKLFRKGQINGSDCLVYMADTKIP
ncbi:DUF6371 domain-containing protein [Chitinophaga defluvii]|uniref:DUF6371 domain-containing protein n=1 Tax=Chitinophaga defluvii TaxID=3163343 RepID=A0ABV2TDH1_9BACT